MGQRRASSMKPWRDKVTGSCVGLGLEQDVSLSSAGNHTSFQVAKRKKPAQFKPDLLLGAVEIPKTNRITRLRPFCGFGPTVTSKTKSPRFDFVKRWRVQSSSLTSWPSLAQVRSFIHIVIQTCKYILWIQAVQMVCFASNVDWRGVFHFSLKYAAPAHCGLAIYRSTGFGKPI